MCFFFSSRRRHTRYWRDWSSDVCSSDLVRGPDGRTLAEAWGGGPEAYLGSTVAGFPNLFLLYGPNTNLGHNSIVYMLESQFRYLLAALTAMRERRIGRLEVREDVQRTYNDEIQRRLDRKST